MGDLIQLLDSLGLLSPVVIFILLPLLLTAAVAAAIRNFADIDSFVSHKVTNRSEYDLLKKIRTEINREHVEGFLGPPPWTMLAMNGTYDIAVYAKPKYIIKIVYEDGAVGMYSVTVRDPKFKPTFQIAGDSYRLGDVTYSDFSEVQILYAQCSSKDCRYAESHYLANLGGFQDLLLATHLPPGIQWDSEGPSVVELCHELNLHPDEYRSVSEKDELVASVRENAKPNCYGFASMGFDDAERVAVGAVYAEIRQLLREG